MANKKCLVFETLGKVSDLNLIKESADGFMRLHGVFGVCGVKNNNNRVYNKNNYGMMVETLQKEITEGSVLGELEHPNSMNINLENVSHKIESIEMNEDGTITGTIVLLNTPKGKIAQAIAEAAGALYISSRGAGSIDGSGNVTLTQIKTYDLVGTPGFSQAKLNLAKGQTLESLNESLEDGNLMYAIVEGDDLLDVADDDKKDDDKSDDKADEKKDDNAEEKKKDDSKDDSKDDDSKDDSKDDDKDDNKNNDKEDVTMNELKEAIEQLQNKIESLQADLHIAKESLIEKDNQIAELKESIENIAPVNYDAIEKWVTSEFANEFTESVMDKVETLVESSIEDATHSIAEGVQNWAINEFAPVVEGYMTEEFAPVVQNWITEEFAPEVQNWVCEEFAPEVQNWICEEYTPQIEGWVCEEFAPTIDKWINEEFAPEHKQTIVNEVNTNVSTFLESQKSSKLSAIDSLLESIENKGSDNAAFELLKEQKEASKYAGVYVVENMPAQYMPQWEMASEGKQREIITRSRMYDFTKVGVLEKFWDTVDFNETKIVESVATPETNYHNAIAAQMRRIGRY